MPGALVVVGGGEDRTGDRAVLRRVAEVAGGDQDRIAAIVGGSATDTAVHRAWARGAVVAGTSAGAAVLSTTMILGGGDRVPTTSVRTGPGLGFVPGVVVDMHFAERGRIARRLAVTGARATSFARERGE